MESPSWYRRCLSPRLSNQQKMCQVAPMQWKYQFLPSGLKISQPVNNLTWQQSNLLFLMTFWTQWREQIAWSKNSRSLLFRSCILCIPLGHLTNILLCDHIQRCNVVNAQWLFTGGHIATFLSGQGHCPAQFPVAKHTVLGHCSCTLSQVSIRLV